MISIVMPCYNCETSLVRTAECIQAQTVADWELIAVDDGSSDGTGAALDALARADARIRVIHQENGGVSRARNAGMAAARGEWLAFADADDVLPPDALATLLALDDGGADILCGAYTIRYTDEGGREERLACAEGDRQTILESLVRTDSTLNSMCAKLYRAAMVREKGLCVPPGVKVGEDVLFNLDAFYAARSWRMTRQSVYRYDLGGDSAMTRARGRFTRAPNRCFAALRALFGKTACKRRFSARISTFIFGRSATTAVAGGRRPRLIGRLPPA
ncbi:MAG: glycosyltransferase family 2 protein [Christensenellales bacterium]